MKLVKLFFVLLICFSSFIVHASVTINEIMYDLEGTDTDREWVEVYNSGGEAIDLSTWKFVEGNSNHSLVPFDGGSTIAPNGYAVIADKPEKFKADWPNFSGVLFDSSFSLGNDPGEELSLKDDTATTVDTVTYVTAVGAQGDGTTLNRNGTVFIVSPATPGIENTTTQNDDTNDETNNDNNSGDTSSGGVSPSLKIIEIATPKITAQIESKLSLVAGTPIIFEPKIRGYSGESLSQGKFFWNLGDGMSIEKNTNEKIMYTYDSPGEYVVSLEYFRNSYQFESDAMDRLVIQVSPPSMVVSSVLSDGSVEITNTSPKETDLFGWVLKADGNSFLFPKNTVILAGRKIMFTPKITRFGPGIQKVEIILPSNQIASVYPQVKKDSLSKKTESVKISYEPSIAKAYAAAENPSSVAAVYTPIELTASVSDSIDGIEGFRILIPLILFIIIVLSGIGIILYFRHTQRVHLEADDFEMVE